MSTARPGAAVRVVAAARATACARATGRAREAPPQRKRDGSCSRRPRLLVGCAVGPLFWAGLVWLGFWWQKAGRSVEFTVRCDGASTCSRALSDRPHVRVLFVCLCAAAALLCSAGGFVGWLALPLGGRAFCAAGRKQARTGSAFVLVWVGSRRSGRRRSVCEGECGAHRLLCPTGLSVAHGSASNGQKAAKLCIRATTRPSTRRRQQRKGEQQEGRKNADRTQTGGSTSSVLDCPLCARDRLSRLISDGIRTWCLVFPVPSSVLPSPSPQGLVPQELLPVHRSPLAAGFSSCVDRLATSTAHVLCFLQPHQRDGPRTLRRCKCSLHWFPSYGTR
jgi:hypothetical protein